MCFNPNIVLPQEQFKALEAIMDVFVSTHNKERHLLISIQYEVAVEQWFSNSYMLTPPWLTGGFLAPPSHTQANTNLI